MATDRPNSSEKRDAAYEDYRHTTDPPPYGRGLTERHVPDPRMGDDGTGHCNGCGCSIGTFNVDCKVCLYALDVIHGCGEADQVAADVGRSGW